MLVSGPTETQFLVLKDAPIVKYVDVFALFVIFLILDIIAQQQSMFSARWERKRKGLAQLVSVKYSTRNVCSSFPVKQSAQLNFLNNFLLSSLVMLDTWILSAKVFTLCSFLNISPQIVHWLLRNVLLFLRSLAIMHYRQYLKDKREHEVSSQRGSRMSPE